MTEEAEDQELQPGKPAPDGTIWMTAEAVVDSEADRETVDETVTMTEEAAEGMMTDELAEEDMMTDEAAEEDTTTEEAAEDTMTVETTEWTPEEAGTARIRRLKIR